MCRSLCERLDRQDKWEILSTSGPVATIISLLGAKSGLASLFRLWLGMGTPFNKLFLLSLFLESSEKALNPLPSKLGAFFDSFLRIGLFDEIMMGDGGLCPRSCCWLVISGDC